MSGMKGAYAPQAVDNQPPKGAVVFFFSLHILNGIIKLITKEKAGARQ